MKSFLPSILLSFLTIFIVLAPTYGYDDDDRPTSGSKAKPPVYHIYDDITLISAVKYRYGKHRTVIKAVYPQLERGNPERDDRDDSDIKSDDLGVNNFNLTVVDTIQEDITEFQNRVNQNQDIQKNLPKSVAKNNLYIDYDTSVVKSGDNHIISIRFSMQGFIGGMAHPYHFHRVLNYDLDDNQRIELDDLFRPDADYLSLLAHYAREALAKRLNNDTLVAQGTAPTPENYKNWNIKPRGLLITFDEGQVAPYVNGAQTVLIPYASLKSALASDSPLASCIKSKRRCVRNNVLTGGFIDEAINARHRMLNPILGKL